MAKKMITLGQRIYEGRKAKGLSQEELADRSKVNLRTIQRLENNENTPRGSTLSLLCNVLELDVQELQTTELPNKPMVWHGHLLKVFFLALLNLGMMAIIGYLTLDSAATLNSRVGALLLSICLPLLVVYKTPHLEAATRVLYYGTGFFMYMLLAIAFVGVPEAFVTGLIPCLSLALAVLYFGQWTASVPQTKR
ncbi:helix-turn-helix domain-containing protein [Cesiribacter andamanensis]|uniref:Transcriptional repressor DicA n=1 Tax=Cesiribacter andamanensis AMV16 TaxID=1279009 RepID=M7N2A2_9BACT|nr:helix-turn-helix transcriptional regulator [Cesiribacter andamanensis]EMR01336.1 transcriptional repressor DicA [Cesiribacter andamanensis AMV16]